MGKNCLLIKDVSGIHVMDLDDVKNLGKIQHKEDAQKFGCETIDVKDVGDNEIISCALSGSHAYGFPSVTSDFDVRCIHQMPTERVLSLEPPKETIRMGTAGEGDIDFESHEIKKHLGLIIKNNSNAIENSVDENAVFNEYKYNEVKSFAERAVSKDIYYTYRGFALSTWRDAKRSNLEDIKTLAYTYRLLMSGIHTLNTGEIKRNIDELNREFKSLTAFQVAHAVRTGKDIYLDKNKVEGEIADFQDKLDEAYKTSKLPRSTAAGVKEDINRFLVDIRIK